MQCECVRNIIFKVENIMEKNNEIEEVSFKLALKMLEYSDLLEEKKKFVIVRQILRSGTSIRANIKEGLKVGIYRNVL